MFEEIAGAKYLAMLQLLTNLFVYHEGADVYLPRYGAIHGEVMRSAMDVISGYTLAQYGISQSQYLMSIDGSE